MIVWMLLHTFFYSWSFLFTSSKCIGPFWPWNTQQARPMSSISLTGILWFYVANKGQKFIPNCEEGLNGFYYFYSKIQLLFIPCIIFNFHDVFLAFITNIETFISVRERHGTSLLSVPWPKRPYTFTTSK